MTIYLFAMQEEQRFQNKNIYTFARHYLPDWFPRLPSYQAFDYRLNRLEAAFQLLPARLLEQFRPTTTANLIDSMPIQTCSAKRKARMERELADTGYCSTKRKYYYGLKLHVLALHCAGTMPFAEHITLSATRERPKYFRAGLEQTNGSCFLWR